MIHIYCGDGKGKTTAAMGLALRAAGRGKKVVVAQFLKGGDTGERAALALLPQVTLLPVPQQVGFVFAMTPAQRQAEADRCRGLLEQARRAAGDCFLLVLDEVCGAVETGLLPPEELLACLDSLDCEVVLTGRNPDPRFLERADYITRMESLRHPFDRGISARSGVEF